MSGNLTPMSGKRVAEIMATRSFSEFVVVGGAGLRVLAPVLRQNLIRPVFSITSSGRPPLVAMMQPAD
jgi:hypothetical protein